MGENDLREDPAVSGAQAEGAGPGDGNVGVAGGAGDPAGHPSTDDIARGSDRADTVGDGRGTDGTAPAGAGSAAAASDAAGEGRAPLFPADQAEALRSRWESIQVGFVDEPRAAVEQADSLVAEVMQTLATTFSHERSGLEGQWSKGEDVSTEDLRQTLRRYRSFFDRLLAL